MQTKDLIKSHRTQKGLSQKDLAELVGVSEATVCRWETCVIKGFRAFNISFLPPPSEALTAYMSVFNRIDG